MSLEVGEIYSYLNELSPFDLQEKWDNSGLLVGNMNDEVTKVYISLDLDLDLLKEVEPNSLIITHHPLIFSPLKKINYDTYATIILKELIKKDISLISMHTNFDITHLNKYVAKEILNLDIIDSDGFIVYANVNKSFDEFYTYIKSKLGIEHTNITKCNEYIKTVGICTGSGMSLLGQLNADCFLTGDIKYHDAMEAKVKEISLIDIKHYESEKHFSPLLLGLIEKYLKKNELKAIMSNSKNPFAH